MSKTVESIRRSLDPALSDRFSEIEMTIMSCLCDGMSNAAIATHCDVSESVVKTRMAVIQRKIGASNRTQVAIWTMKRGQPIDLRRRGPARSASEA